MSWTLDRIVLREIHLPLREPFKISSGVVTTRRILLLELTDRDGTSVWSEGVAMATPNYSPETVDTMWQAIRDWVAPRVLGRAFDHPQEVAPALEVGFRGHRMAKAAVEMGCWGLEAVRRGVALATLIEGQRETIATGISLGVQPTPEALVDKVVTAFSEGYRKVKIKIEPGSDLAFLQAARDAVGPDAGLMADANSAYTLDDADHLARFDALDLMMIEQPLGWNDLHQHAELQRRLATPVCLDESITDLARAEEMVAFGSGRIINLKPGRVGGFADSLAIHALCQRYALPLWCGGMLETGIGRAYNVALASLPGFTLPGDVSPSARYWQQDITDPEWTMESGWVRVPYDRPGLGVTVDTERIAALTVREETLRPTTPGGQA